MNKISQVDFLHSLPERIQTVLSRGKHSNSNANLDCFQMQILRVTWRIQKINVMISSEYFRKPHICSRWAVSHGSTEAQVISVDVGLRPDGSLASSLWDIVIDVLDPEEQGNPMRHAKKKPQVSKNNGVKQSIEDLDLFPRLHTPPDNVRPCSFSRKMTL